MGHVTIILGHGHRYPMTTETTALEYYRAFKLINAVNEAHAFIKHGYGMSLNLKVVLIFIAGSNVDHN